MSPITATRLKLIGLFIVSNIILFTRDGFWVIGSISILVAGVILTLGRINQFTIWIKGLGVVMTLILLIQTFTFNGFGYTQEGLLLGLFSILRIFALTSIVFLFIQTTKLQYVAKSLSFLPFHLGFVLTISVGMIESLQNEARTIQMAQRARGYRSSWNPIKTYLPLLLPLFSRSITRAEKLAIAMQTRGFKIR